MDGDSMDQGEDGGVRLDWSRSVNRKRKETTCGRTSAMRNKNVLASRVKRVMQGDEDVGKIAHASPVLIAKALELFLEDLCHKVAETTTERGARTISPGHLKQCILKHEKFDFLKDVVAKVPDLPPVPKRRRTREEDGDFKPRKGDGETSRGRMQPKRKVKRERSAALAELSTESSGEERDATGKREERKPDASGPKNLAMEFPSGEQMGGLNLEAVPQSAALVIPEVAARACIGDEEDDYD